MLRITHRQRLLAWGTVLIGGTALAITAMVIARPMVVAGDSMAPTIEKGDVVVMVETPVEEIRPGDVVARDDGPATLVHRVEDVARPGQGQALALSTAGDANETADPTPFLVEGTVGRVVATLPAVGRPALAVRDAPLRLGLVVIPAALLFFGRTRRPAPMGA